VLHASLLLYQAASVREARLADSLPGMIAPIAAPVDMSCEMGAEMEARLYGSLDQIGV